MPDEEMALPAVTGLLSGGLKPNDPAPKKLAQADLDSAVRVITFCDLPPDLEAVSPAEHWEVLPIGTDYARSREAMLAHIEQLLLELKN